MTAGKECPTNCNDQRKKFCLSLHNNEVNSYIVVNGVEMQKFEGKDSKINAAPLSLGNVSKDFSADNMKRLDCMDMSMIFQLIVMMMIFLIFTNIQ